MQTWPYFVGRNINPLSREGGRPLPLQYVKAAKTSSGEFSLLLVTLRFSTSEVVSSSPHQVMASSILHNGRPAFASQSSFGTGYSVASRGPVMSFLLLTLTLLISLGSVVQYAEAISFPPDSRSLSARHFSSGGEYTRPIFGGRDEGILRRERRVHSRQAANSTDATPGGLPTNIIPTHYNLTLEPDFVTYNFDGTVVIDLDVVRDANKITLNFDQTYGSNITEASLSVFYNSSSSVEW